MSAMRQREGARFASDRGFTLVEVMVALVILATGALAITQLSLSVAMLMQQSTAKTELITFAENRLEAVQAMEYEEIVAGVLEDTVVVRGHPYVRRVTITEPNSRMREIRIDLRSSVESLTYSALTYVVEP